eukprot:UN17162
MGRVDDELWHGNDFCRKLQGSNSDGLHQLGCAGVEGVENYRCCEEAKELGMLADPGPEVEGYVERNFQD